MSKQNPKNLTALVGTTADEDKAVEQQAFSAPVQNEAQEQDKSEQVTGVVEAVVGATTAEVSEQVTGGEKTAEPVLTGVIVKKAVAATVAAQDPAVGVVAVAQAPTTDPLSEDLERVLADVPAAFRADITRLVIYCKTMAPGKPVSEKVGAVEQSALYRLIQNIINRQEQYFKPLFTALLLVFHHERKGALGDRHRNRFMEHVVLSKADRDAMQAITHTLFIVADTKSRELALKQVNLEKALSSGLTAEGQRRVLQYFGV